MKKLILSLFMFLSTLGFSKEIILIQDKIRGINRLIREGESD